MRRPDKKSDNDKNANYKNLIAQYYDRDPHLTDVKSEIRAITPDIQILEELNQFQKKIDSLIKTKRYDVQEMYMKPAQKIKRVLRVMVVKEQSQGQPTIKIYGQIYPKKEETSGCRFTTFFRQIVVVSEKDKSVVESWKKPTAGFSQKDGVIIKLPNNLEDAISVNLTLISNPPKFTVDPHLEKIVGMKIGTRVEILDALWLYIKTKKLQDVENKEIINSDDLIRQAFKTQKLTFATINNRVRELLVPAEPIKIILSDQETQKIYDIIVEIEERPSVDIVPFFSQKLNEEKNDHPFLSMMGKIKKYENKFKQHTEKLRRHLLKRDFYSNFKASSVEDIIKQQNELLKIIKKKDSIEEYNKLGYILKNEDELQREVKHYFDNLNQSRSD